MRMKKRTFLQLLTQRPSKSKTRVNVNLARRSSLSCYEPITADIVETHFAIVAVGIEGV